MSVYLHDIPLPQARARLQQALLEADLWRVLGVESVPVDELALGRVLAETVWARRSSPHYHASAMDGFAVRAGDTAGAQPSSPLTLHVGSDTRYLDTGDALPLDFDSVIPIENVEALDEQGNLTPAIRQPVSVRIRASVPPWSHVRPMGEDIVATQMVLPAGHVLRPVDLGAVAASGHREIRVARRPKVAILPTGSELVPIGAEPGPGEILEYNSLVMAAQIQVMGGAPARHPITRDDFDLLCERVENAAQGHDLILLNAGSSAGAEDFTARVVDRLGTVLVHGVAVRPGHPVILGMVKRRNGRLIPILGVPGYPVSAALTMEIFVEPILAHWLGRPPAELPVEKAFLTRKVTSPAGDDDYIRMVVGRVGDKLLATPLARGAGVITSLVQADGLMILPGGVQGLEAGREVDIHLYRSRADLERTIFCVGSHDLTIDLLAQFLSEKDRRLVSANVGSQGGLIALGRGEAHLAGAHLLDPATGEYNLPFLGQYMPQVKARVIGLVRRDQGLLVKPGNPLGLSRLEDLARPGVRFVNRQRGAGTRVLLDYHLSRLGIVPAGIIGYNREEFTHLGIAAAVASDRADCGLGIAAAAQALQLDFVPLFQERYDLVIPAEHAESGLLAPLFEVLAGGPFQAEVTKLFGYDVSVMGTLIAEV